MNKVIGIDIGGTNFRIGCVDDRGKVIYSKKCPSVVFCEQTSALSVLAEEIKKFIASNNIENIDAIAAGFPSPVSREGIVYSCPNLKNKNGSFDGKNVRVFLEEEFNVPAFVLKDANFLLQAEIQEQKITKDQTVIGIYFGTGIGNSVYYAGDFVIGKNGSGCDLGHMPILKSNRVCTCGNVGCIECYAAGHVLVSLWKEKFADTPFEEIFVKHEGAQELIDFVDACAIPVGTEINIFDPELVVLGGGVLDMKGFPYDYLLKRIYDYVRKPMPAEALNIKRASVTVDAGIKGAAGYAFLKLKDMQIKQ